MSSLGPRSRQVLGEVEARGVVGIVRATDPEDALARGRALVAAGLAVVEVSLTTPDAVSVIAALQETREARNGTAHVGAGTVRTREDLDRMLAAGAGFVVSPVLVDDVVAAAVEADVAAFPGCATPTEILRAVDLGAAAAKVFPAQLWGPAALAAVLEAMPDVRTIPTGGVDAANAGAWIAAGATAVGVGGSLTRASDPQAAVARLYATIRAARGDRSPR